MRRQERIEELSRQFHIRYEENASYMGWGTQPASRQSWEKLPIANRRTTRMTVWQVVGPLLDEIDRLKERVAELEAP